MHLHILLITYFNLILKLKYFLYRYYYYYYFLENQKHVRITIIVIIYHIWSVIPAQFLWSSELSPNCKRGGWVLILRKSLLLWEPNSPTLMIWVSLSSSMAIQFKFRSSVNFDSVDIEGRPSISVGDLKSKIIRMKNLDSCKNFDLVFSDAQTGQGIPSSPCL